MLREHAFQPDVNALHTLLNCTCEEIDAAENHTQLVLVEAKLTKALYKMVSQAVRCDDFTRAKRGDGVDMTDRFLDQGNHLAYGLAAVAAQVVGIPHGLVVMHGKTHRGGLVFNLADLAKNALVIPRAFITAMAGEDTREFRQCYANIFQQTDALDVMITSLQETTQALARADQ